jgi:acetylglutamate kinase
MTTPLVIKLGGAVLNSPEALANLFDAIKAISGQPLVLVHGGGIIVENLLAGLGLKSEKIDGLRVTPAEHIDYIVGALAGTSNKKLSAQALKAGQSAVGLCLGDAGITTVTQMDPRLGHVGSCEAGNPALLNTLLEAGHLPVISSIGIADGALYNINADQAAIAIAKMLKAQLVLLSDVDGVWDANKQVIAELTPELASKLIEQGVIKDGMMVKVNAALDASAFIGQPVALASWKDSKALSALLKGEAVGTKVSANS